MPPSLGCHPKDATGSPGLSLHHPGVTPLLLSTLHCLAHIVLQVPKGTTVPKATGEQPLQLRPARTQGSRDTTELSQG